MFRVFRRMIFAASLAGMAGGTQAVEIKSDWSRHLEMRDLQGASLQSSGHWIVFVFLSSECPVANADIPALNALAAEFSSHDFSFIGVYCDPTARLTELRRHAAEYHIKFSTVDDREQKLVRSVGATYTPEIFVFSREGVLLYRGRIDDRVGELGASRPAATRRDLREVLAALVAGQPGPFPSRPGFGCAIAEPVKP